MEIQLEAVFVKRRRLSVSANLPQLRGAGSAGLGEIVSR